MIANSPDREAALAGLERWKSKHPEVATLLAVDDVLIDSMRGRSSTWTRIRVNLRNVPEGLRPPQETPDPDEDPTREWREASNSNALTVGSQSRFERSDVEQLELLNRRYDQRPPAKITASSCGGTTSSWS